MLHTLHGGQPQCTSDCYMDDLKTSSGQNPNEISSWILSAGNTVSPAVGQLQLVGF